MGKGSRRIELARREVAHERPARRIDEREVRALALVPARPMAIEQLVRHPHLQLAFETGRDA